MGLKKLLKIVSVTGIILFLAVVLRIAQKKFVSAQGNQEVREAATAASVSDSRQVKKPKYVRGIHLTSWVTGSSKFRAALDQLLDETELNTVVIDIKEYEGEVYIPGVKTAEEHKTYVKAIPDIAGYLASLKKRGVYTIARIVVFKDNMLPKRKPEWAVKTPEGTTWKDHRGNMWVDPYRKEIWDYNLDIAERAVDLGFDEIQFDYIRFPSDGHTQSCRYITKHSSSTAAEALEGFLEEAHTRLKPRGANLSIDVFGLTTTVAHDMGIGQKIVKMAKWVDYVSPMVYPSHYAKGEYGIPDPNKEPYRTVYLGMAGAKKKLGAVTQIRPYLQDFSLGYHYGAKEVEAQIQATYDNDIGEWLLWNPRCVYTRAALRNKKFSDTYEKSKNPPVFTTKHTIKEARTVPAEKQSGQEKSPVAVTGLQELPVPVETSTDTVKP